jgi:hypothetical protein
MVPLDPVFFRGRQPRQLQIMPSDQGLGGGGPPQYQGTQARTKPDPATDTMGEGYPPKYEGGVECPYPGMDRWHPWTGCRSECANQGNARW